MAEKIAFITGGNRGLGFQTALELKGVAKVVIGSRDLDQGECGGAGAAGSGRGGGRVEAGGSLAGGDDCGAARRSAAVGSDERGGAGVGASECGAGYCGDGGAGRGGGRNLATDSHGFSRIDLSEIPDSSLVFAASRLQTARNDKI